MFGPKTMSKRIKMIEKIIMWSYIILLFKSRKMRWARHVACMQM
jgi:hypothetical protein